MGDRSWYCLMEGVASEGRMEIGGISDRADIPGG